MSQQNNAENQLMFTSENNVILVTLVTVAWMLVPDGLGMSILETFHKTVSRVYAGKQKNIYEM